MSRSGVISGAATSRPSGEAAPRVPAAQPPPALAGAVAGRRHEGLWLVAGVVLVVFLLAQTVVEEVLHLFESPYHSHAFIDLAVILGFAGVLAVSRHKRLSAERRHRAEVLALASTDTVTGLANRWVFVATAEHEIERSERYGGAIAVLLWDLNNFKELNDREGHQAGDGALRAFADLLRSCARDTDIVARVGGDEFMVLMLEGTPAAARALHRRLSGAICSLTAETGISAAYGAAFYPHDGTTIDALMARADGRMYAHKRALKRSGAAATRDASRGSAAGGARAGAVA